MNGDGWDKEKQMGHTNAYEEVITHEKATLGLTGEAGWYLYSFLVMGPSLGVFGA